MGRQIEFVHIEADMIPFLSAIEKSGGYILSNESLISPPTYLDTIISQMATPVGQHSIVSTNMFVDSFDVLSRNVVEFDNCSKGNSLSRVYEVGRLYIFPTSEGAYDPTLLKLFDTLRKYIKQNYIYSKNAKIYYSPLFKEQYDRCYYYVARDGRRISL